MGSKRRRYDSGNPLQPGNALKNKNFDKAVFRYLFITVLILLMIAACAHYILHLRLP
ncbi:hypothetical protein BH10ACI4_BH10ACI4_07650 [soil metagenome]